MDTARTEETTPLEQALTDKFGSLRAASTALNIPYTTFRRGVKDPDEFRGSHVRRLRDHAGLPFDVIFGDVAP